MSHYHTGLLKFDREILKIVATSQDLRKRIYDLTIEWNEVGNDFSARLLSNREILPLIECYAKIVRNYELIGKEFSQLDVGLENIMAVEYDVEELLADIKKKFEVLNSNISFQTNFDEGRSYIVEVLTPAVDRLIGAGKVMHLKAQEILNPLNPFKSHFPKIIYKVRRKAFWLIFGMSFGLFIYGIISNHADWLLFGTTVVLILCLLLVFLLAFFKLNRQNKQIPNNQRSEP